MCSLFRRLLQNSLRALNIENIENIESRQANQLLIGSNHLERLEEQLTSTSQPWSFNYHINLSFLQIDSYIQSNINRKHID